MRVGIIPLTLTWTAIAPPILKEKDANPQNENNANQVEEQFRLSADFCKRCRVFGVINIQVI